MNGLTRLPTRLLMVGATIVSLTILTIALVPTASASQRSEGRSGVLRVTKECSQYHGLPDQHCTITASNLGEIKVGSRIVYLEALPPPYTTLNSDVVVVVGTGNFALGHCDVTLPSGPGECTLSGGRGSFARLHARVAVTQDSTNPRLYYWTGTYRFGSDD
jgi:hypothetical protein